MAKSEYSVDVEDGYQSTQAYHNASPARRKQINRYKKENDISDEHMYLLLFKQDLDSVPKSVQDNSDTLSKAMLVIGFLLLFNSLQLAMSNQNGANVSLIFLSLGSFGLVMLVSYTGMLNPYKRAVREVDKRLKSMPEVPDFTEWDLAHPSAEDRKAQRTRKSR